MPLMALDPFASVQTTQPSANRAMVAYPTIAPTTASASPTQPQLPTPQARASQAMSPVTQPVQNTAATPGIMDPLAFAPQAPPLDVMSGATTAPPSMPLMAPDNMALAPNWYSAPQAQPTAQSTPMAFQQALDLLR